jgi:hypothetical protein
MDGRDFAGWDGSLEWLHRTVDERREANRANDFVDPAERTQKWWFELDEVDGELVIPTGRNPQKICREYPLQRQRRPAQPASAHTAKASQQDSTGRH